MYIKLYQKNIFKKKKIKNNINFMYNYEIINYK